MPEPPQPELGHVICTTDVNLFVEWGWRTAKYLYRTFPRSDMVSSRGQRKRSDGWCRQGKMLTDINRYRWSRNYKRVLERVCRLVLHHRRRGYPLTCVSQQEPDIGRQIWRHSLMTMMRAEHSYSQFARTTTHLYLGRLEIGCTLRFQLISTIMTHGAAETVPMI